MLHTSQRRRSLSSPIVSRRGAWITLLAALIIVVGLMGALRGSEPPGAVDTVPPAAESARAAELQQEFPNSELAPVMAVFSKGGAALSDADLETVATVGTDLAAAVGQESPRPITSEDGQAALVSIPIDADRPNAEIADTIERLRTISHAAAPEGMTIQITGGPAFGADIASSFDGANFTLLAVTIGIVALLLLLTYRSPVLWLIPLAVVGLADQTANVVTAWVGDNWDLAFDKGIISVLVFGAGTNYALLLISRYREELQLEDDHRAALRTAVHGTAPAILASNVTVVLSLLTLVFAAMPSTRGLGIASAVGLAIAVVFGLLVLPAALAVCGRRLFWPFVPRTGNSGREEGRTWSTIARGVTRRPLLVVVGSIALLAVFASGLLGTRVGLSQTEQFRVASESAAGFDVLADHFPPGESEPMIVITKSAAAEEVVDAAADAPGVSHANLAGESDTGLTKVIVVGADDPGTKASYQTIRDVRAAVHDVPGADALVGGQNAESLDIEDASWADLQLIAPMILAVVLVILMILLRSLLAPLLLVAINVSSAIAAIGLGTWVGKRLFDFPALDVNVPLLAFLFLVALGVDYTIFLVHRAMQSAEQHGTRVGMIRALGHTGAVITSAGVVLAAVFAALGILPLVTLGQLGLIVGLGVLVDTLFVRTILVPAVFALLGDRIWWPRRPVATDHQ